MFTTLNLRWIIDLKEREMQGGYRVGKNLLSRWLPALVRWFSR
jgi:hypothetical protein